MRRRAGSSTAEIAADWSSAAGRLCPCRRGGVVLQHPGGVPGRDLRDDETPPIRPPPWRYGQTSPAPDAAVRQRKNAGVAFVLGARPPARDIQARCVTIDPSGRAGAVRQDRGFHRRQRVQPDALPRALTLQTAAGLHAARSPRLAGDPGAFGLLGLIGMQAYTQSRDLRVLPARPGADPGQDMADRIAHQPETASCYVIDQYGSRHAVRRHRRDQRRPAHAVGVGTAATRARSPPPTSPPGTARCKALPSRPAALQHRRGARALAAASASTPATNSYRVARRLAGHGADRRADRGRRATPPAARTLVRHRGRSAAKSASSCASQILT